MIKPNIKFAAITAAAISLLFVAAGPSVIDNLRVAVSDKVSDGSLLVYRGGQFVDEAPTGQAIGIDGPLVQYVEMDGKDSNSGFSRQTALRSVNTALERLGNGRKTGSLYIGPGEFDVSPMVIGGRIRIHGAGTETNNPGNGGTFLRLKNGSNAPMFSAKEVDGRRTWQHHLIIEGMTLDGNKVNQEGRYDIAAFNGGGFNFVLRDLFFTNAGLWGIRITQSVVDGLMTNITGGFCGELMEPGEEWDAERHGGFLYLDFATGPGGADTLLGQAWQIDACGEFPIAIKYGKAHGGNIVLTSIKAETAGKNGCHKALVRYDGADGVHDRLNLHMVGVVTNNLKNGVPNNIALVWQPTGRTPVNFSLTDGRTAGGFSIYKNEVTGQDDVLGNTMAPIALYSNQGTVMATELRLRPQVFQDGDPKIAKLRTGTVYATENGGGYSLHIKL